MVITFKDVTFKYSTTKLLDFVSFSFTENDKIGVVGSNGCGKTTLLKLIMGEEQTVSGSIIISGNMKISYLQQDPILPMGITIFQCLKKLENKDHKIEDYQIQTMLNKLKLFNHGVKTDNLSGGERKRVALAMCLLQENNMLLLDEPTNHLDQDMIVWLEGFLKKWKHGLFMVTHDRYFLQNVCSKILELEFGKTYLYDANYSTFLELKEARIKKAIQEEKKHKSLYTKELAWILRGAQARTTKSKSRIERFEQLAAKKFQKKKDFEFSSLKTYIGTKLIEIINGSKAFDNKVLFENFNFKLNRYDRIGIVGANGSGKTTLFRIIMGEEELSSGELILGETLRVGYFSQQLLLSDDNMTVFEYINEESNSIETADGTITGKEMLQNFLFDDDKIYGYVKLLSGGEKRRLQLVRVLMKNPNILILDEPTNDLDLQTLEILENYLEDFFGPVIVVAHDRYFLDKVCDTLLVFEEKRIVPYAVSFSKYYLNLKTESKEAKQKQVYKPVRRLSSAIKNEYNELPIKIEEVEKQIDSTKLELSKQTTDYCTIMDLTKKVEELEEQRDRLMNRYIELDEMINEQENN